MIKYLEGITTVTPPPSQRVIAQVRYQKPTCAVTITQPNVVDVLTHNKQKILKLALGTIKRRRLVQLDLPGDQVWPLHSRTTASFGNRSLHRRRSKRRGASLHSLHGLSWHTWHTWHRCTCSSSLYRWQWLPHGVIIYYKTPLKFRHNRSGWVRRYKHTQTTTCSNSFLISEGVAQIFRQIRRSRWWWQLIRVQKRHIISAKRIISKSRVNRRC